MDRKICGSERRCELIHISQTQTIYFPFCYAPESTSKKHFHLQV